MSDELKELMDLVPGFIGYEKKEFRESSDRAFREFTAEEIHKIMDRIRRLTVFAPMLLTGDRMMMIEQILYKLDNCRREILSEKYIPKEFGEKDIPKENIDKLVSINLKIIKMVLKLGDLMVGIEKQGITHPNSLTILKMISEGLDVLLNRIRERISILSTC